MGELPEQIVIVCPGCSTQFRLKPKKDSLPEAGIPCPRCGEQIPIVDDAGSGTPGEASQPAAAAAHLAKSRRDTATGSPRLPARAAAMEDDDDFEHLDVSRGLLQNSPKSTFLGMGATLAAIKSPAQPSEDHTAVVSNDVLEQIRRGIDVSHPTPEDAGSATPEKAAEEPAESDHQNTRKTSEHPAIQRTPFSTFRMGSVVGPAPTTADAADEHESQDAAQKLPAPPNPAPPGQMILGRVSVKQRLKRRLQAAGAADAGEQEDATDEALSPQEAADASNPLDTAPAPHGEARAPADTDSAGESIEASAPNAFSEHLADTAERPSLSALLKKARERKISLPAPAAPGGDAKIPAPQDPRTDEARRESAAALDRALSALADETARALSAQVPKPPTLTATRAPLPYQTGDSSMIELLRRRVAENQQPGAASERRGSGYIRLPTAEIQEVLGQGSYRLRVEDIIYEPIDKVGLTELVKRGVLLGAAEIAESDGDWMPIAEHPVLAELRTMMAAEAHDLLAKYSSTSTAASPAKKPAENAPWPSAPANESLTDEYGDLKDSTEIPVPLQTGDLFAGLAGGDDDFANANSGLFAEVDRQRNTPSPFSTHPPAEAPDAAEDESLTDSEPEATLSLAETEEAAVPESDLEVSLEESDEPKDGTAPDPEVPLEDPAPADDTVSHADAPAVHVADVEPSPLTHAEPVAASDTRSGGSRKGLLLAALVVIGLLGLIGLALSPIGKPYLDEYLPGVTAPTPDASRNADAPQAQTGATEAPQPPSDPEAVAAAVNAARAQVHGAQQVDTTDAQLLTQMAATYSERGDHAAAARVMRALWPANKTDADFTARYAATLIQANEFGRAVQAAVHGMNLKPTGRSKKHNFAQLYEDAIDKNPELGAYHTVDLTTQKHADAMSVTRRGKNSERLVLNFSLHSTPTFAFHPSQQDWEHDWRTSIAAWRLCQMMVCNFTIPRTRPARMDRATFDKLLAANQDDAAALKTLRWQDENGTQYIYGALVDVIPTPAPFPIELTGLWRPWLNVDGPDLAGLTPADALQSLENEHANFYQPLMAQLSGTDLPHLAAQLSSIMVFDFLTNNWDRFGQTPDRWGAHLGVLGGEVISTVNLTAFQPRSSTRVKGRFEWTSRFSRDTITSLRVMSPETVTPLLFPKASASEKASIAVFWSQRDLILKRTDKLSTARGDKKVFAFD